MSDYSRRRYSHKARRRGLTQGQTRQVMPCRPVLMSSYLETAGFTHIERYYRPTRKSIVALNWGQDIVLAQKE